MRFQHRSIWHAWQDSLVLFCTVSCLLQPLCAVWAVQGLCGCFLLGGLGGTWAVSTPDTMGRGEGAHGAVSFYYWTGAVVSGCMQFFVCWCHLWGACYILCQYWICHLSNTKCITPCCPGQSTGETRHGQSCPQLCNTTYLLHISGHDL